MAFPIFLANAKKGVSLADLPPEAWEIVVGGESGGKKGDRLQGTVAFLHRCVRVRANSLSAVPWYIYDSGGEPVVGHQGGFEDMPWLQPLPQLLWLTEAALALTAKSFWYIERNRAGTKLSLHWLSPTTVKPIWDPSEGLVGFERRVGGNTVSFQPEEIVYIRLPNPMHETEPDIPPAQAALGPARVLHNLDLFAAHFFSRGAIRPTILTVKGDPPERERILLKRWWQRVIAGINNAFSSEVVSGDVQPVIIGDGLESLSNSSLTNEKREDIATALGVPHSIVLSNAANYATAQQDALNFYQQTIVPDCVLIQGQLNEQLFGDMGLEFRFDWQSMSVFQDDEERRASAFKLYVDGGIPPHVAAEILGLTLPGGMTYADLAPGGGHITPAAIPANGDDPIRAMEEKQFRRWARRRLPSVDVSGFESEVLTNDDKIRIVSELGGTVKAVLRLDPDDDEAEREERIRIERKLSRPIQDGLSYQFERVKATHPERLDLESVPRWAENDLQAALSRRPTEEELYDALRTALAESADLGVRVAIRQLEKAGNLAFDWTLAHTEARRWASQYTGQLIGGLNATTRQRVVDAVTEWVQNGQPLDALIAELSPIFGRERAELIASTEVTRAYAEGSRRAYQQAGLTYWQWATAADERVCPICGPLNGQTVAIGTDFSGVLPDEVRQGIRVERFDAPPAHPRCRCWVRPWVP